MSRMLGVIAVSVGWVLCAAPRSSAELQLLMGVENTRLKVGVEPMDATITGDWTARQSTSAFALELSQKQNLKLRVAVGSGTCGLDRDDNSQGMAGGFYMSLGAGIETELESGGGMIVDVSYSFGRVDWDIGPVDYDRTSLVFAYAFGNRDESRPYAGIAYNTYELGVPSAGDFEEGRRFSAVGGVRVRTETFVGFIEATLVGELGLRVGLMFGF